MRKKLTFSLFFLHLLIIFYFWFRNSGQLFFSSFGNTLIAIGRLLGLLGVTFILIQFLIMGRSVWLEQTFGLDKLSQIHHLNGYFSLTFILLHPIIITLGFSVASGFAFLDQFFIFINSYEDVLSAAIGVLILLTTIFFSIIRKRLKYEFWYFIHLFNYLAIFLIWGHQLENGEDFLANKWFVYYWYLLYIFVFGSHLIFRFLRQLINFSNHQFFVEKIKRETHDTISIYISGKNMDTFKIEAGQFMIVRFLNKKFWWQAHPFSLSQAPNGRNLRITPKGVGDFTRDLPTYLKPGTKVLIDGPFGIFTQKLAQKNKFLFIAGGIGITPIRSMIEKLVPQKKNLVLLYANKTKEDIVFLSELEQLRRINPFLIYHFFSEQVTTDKMQRGRVDRYKIKNLVKDYKERDVYLCGPPPMMAGVVKELQALGVPMSQIHFEKFALN